MPSFSLNLPRRGRSAVRRPSTRGGCSVRIPAGSRYTERVPAPSAAMSAAAPLPMVPPQPAGGAIADLDTEGVGQPTVDPDTAGYYRSHMITTLRRAKAELSEMVRRAQAGEEVIITVHSQPAARLLACTGAPSAAARKAWLRELASLRRQTKSANATTTTEAILAEDRKEDSRP